MAETAMDVIKRLRKLDNFKPEVKPTKECRNCGVRRPRQ